MAIAEIITIGTELLLGEIQDTNSKYLARILRDIGVDIYRLTTVGDNQSRITATIQEALMRADIIITTGGLGPTIDDPTRQAVADAINVNNVFLPELWQTILSRYERYARIPTENNKRQAYVPEGAIVIENLVGTAPAFAVELGKKSIISLPGVPREMEYLMQNFVLDYLKKRYSLQESIIVAKVIHTASFGESSIDEKIADLEVLSNPTVGLLAKPGQTDIRVTAKAASKQDAYAMIEPVVSTLAERLGNVIFGYDQDTLEQVVGKLITQRGIRTGIIESGMNGDIIESLKAVVPDMVVGEWLDVQLSDETIKNLIKELEEQEKAQLILAVRLTPNGFQYNLNLFLYYDGKIIKKESSYGGPPGDAGLWAKNITLDTIRRKLNNTL